MIQEKQWAVFCHVAVFAGFVFPFGNIIGPLILWLLKKDESYMVKDQGAEVVNFQITLTALMAVAGILMFFWIGFILMPIVVFMGLFFTIRGIVTTAEGRFYRYPFSFKIV